MSSMMGTTKVSLRELDVQPSSMMMRVFPLRFYGPPDGMIPRLIGSYSAFLGPGSRFGRVRRRDV